MIISHCEWLITFIELVFEHGLRLILYVFFLEEMSVLPADATGNNLFWLILEFDDSDNIKLTLGFNSITLRDFSLEPFNLGFLFLLNTILDRVNFMPLDGNVVLGVWVEEDSDKEEEWEEKSFNFEDEVKTKLPVASLILLKLRVLRLTFCDHDPFKINFT